MIVTHRFRLLPNKRQHRALELILESQRQLYNAALEERIDAYRKLGITRTYFDQCKALTEWRRSDVEGSTLPVSLQRATLKRLDEAFRGLFRRVRLGRKAGFPRFRGKGWFDSFGFRQFAGIAIKGNRLRFKGMPGSLRIHVHRELPTAAIRSCTFKRDPKGWNVAFVTEVEGGAPIGPDLAVGLDLGITTFVALSDGGFIPSLRAARKAERKLSIAHRSLARKKRGSPGPP